MDLHVHAAPDLTDRIGDDVEIARACAANGMAGMAVKAHVESTASRAIHTKRQIPKFNYIGGICLNYPVGGINPSAVEACLRLGGRIIWMPSGHAKFHADTFGTLGLWPASGLLLPSPRGALGISVLNDEGELTTDTKDVVALAREHNALVATSHLSPREGLALVQYCQAMDVKSLITHIGWTAAYDFEYARAASEAGAFMEITASVVASFAPRFPLADVMTLIDELGPERIILASDAGGVLAPAPHEILRVLGRNLSHNGITDEALRIMMCENPIYLVSQ